MPYELIWEARGVLCRFSGIASDDDLRQANFDIYSNPKFEEIDYELVDFTDVTEFNVERASCYCCFQTGGGNLGTGYCRSRS